MIRLSGVCFRFSMLVATLLVVGGISGSAVAQTGPGGVGTTDGSSDQDLKLWVRGESGIETGTGGDADSVTTWLDQSGFGHDLINAQEPSGYDPSISGENVGQPTTTGDPGFSVVRFNDQSTNEGDGQTLDSPDLGIPGDAGFTYFVVVDVYGNVTPDDVSNSGGGTYIFDRTSNTNPVTSLKISDEGSSPPQFGFQKRDDSDNNLGGPTSTAQVNTTQGKFQVVGIQKQYAASGSDDTYRIFVDGALDGTVTSDDGQVTPPKIRLGAHKERDALDGDVAELVAYEGAVNKAKRVIVQNYLAAKYSSAVSLSSNDQFSHDANHGNDVAGVGQASDGSQHLDAESAQLRIRENGADLSNGDFLLIGHDNQALSFTSTNPNGDPNAQKVGRQWRADLDPNATNGSESQTVDITVDLSSLSLPSGTNDYGLFVDEDGDGDFTSGATFYDIDKSTGDAVDVTIGDDDYVTIAAVKRTVQFASADGAGFENAGGGSLGAPASPTLNVTLNYPSNTDIAGIPYDVSEVTSTLNEDTDETFGNEGTNGQEDYRRVDDTFTFPASAGEGPFNFNTKSAIAANDTALVVLNDGRDASSDSDEQSPEDLDVTLTGSFPSDVAVGGTSTHTFSINDDDDPRKVSFSGTSGKGVSNVSENPEEDSDPNTDNLSGKENTVGTVTFEVALPSGETGSASTFATFEVTGAGTDDFDIPANGDNNKLTDRRGEVKIASGNRYATFDLTITDESVFESDETLTVELTSARSATLDPSGSANLDFDYTILNDDTEPQVSFVSASDSGDEGSAFVTGTLQLNNPAEIDLTVDFSVSGTATDGGTDYTQNASSPVTIAAGNTQRDLDFTVEEDGKLETPETIAVTINDNATTDPPVGSPSTFTYTIEDNDQLGATGPAGVGSDASNVLWLRADAISNVSDGANIGTWTDESGNANDAVQTTGGKPVYKKSVSTMNGLPTVRFVDPSGSGNGDFLDTSDPPDISSSSGYTYFIVSDLQSDVSTGGTEDGTGTYILDRPSGVQPLVSLKVVNDNGPKLAYQTRDGDGSDLGAAVSNTDPGTSLGNPTLVTMERDVGNAFRIFVDGNEEGTFNDNGGDLSPPTLRIGRHAQDDGMDGDIAEIIVFNATLGQTTQTLVQNYLAAKYDIPLDTGDKYAGDQNGDYDRGVFGVGQESSSNFHPAAETDGLRLDAAGGLSNGDYLIAGHRTPSNSVTTSDIGGVSGTLEARSERTWFVDKTGSPTADVTITLSKAGLTGPAGDPGSYVLLTRSDTTGGANWSATGGTPSISDGDAITFSGVSLSDEHEITLGTTNRTDSPLNTNNLVVEGTVGTDSDDEGWRYMGLPVTNAAASDLLRADGSQFINFNVAMAQTNFGGDGTGSGWSPITDPSTALASGRGFVLWLYDSPQYPLDPNITLQVSDGLSAPGATDVVVGNGPIDEDPSLNQSDEFFMLANPYATPYDLGSLGNVGSDGFDDNVKIWKANATDGGNDPSGTDDGGNQYGTFMNFSRGNGDDIASWQGFLAVRTSTGSGNTSLRFGSAGRSPGATVDFVGSKSGEKTGPTQHRIPLRLVGRDAKGNLVALDRAASVLFRTGTSPGRDAFDSPKMEPVTSSFATLAPVATPKNGKAVSRSAESRPLPPRDTTITIPLSFQYNDADDGTNVNEGTFTISMPAGGEISTQTPSYPTDWTVTLVDTKGTEDPSDDATQTLTPSGADYTFEIAETGTKTASKSSDPSTTAKGGTEETLPPPTLRRLPLPDATKTALKKSTSDPSTRFALQVEIPKAPAGNDPSSPDPERPTVEVSDLTAQRDEDRVLLQWGTTAKTNSPFQVQHQRLPADDTTATPAAADWKNIGEAKKAKTKKADKNTPSYRFRTDDLEYGRHVFRLKQVDGTATAQVDVQFRLGRTYAVEAPYPNPATQTATLPVTVKNDQRVTVEIYDILGRRVHVVRNNELRGQETKLITLPVQDLSSGAYFVRVRGDEFTTTERLTVVR